jgi:hypothetical protein
VVSGVSRTFFQPVNGGDVQVIERGEDLRFAREAGEPLKVVRERLRQDLDRHRGRGDHLVAHYGHGAAHDGRVAMENAFGILIGITFIIAVITLLDWLGQRRERNSRNRAA